MSEVSNKVLSAAGAPTEASPTRDQRLQLVRAFQSRAMRRQDPLVANLEVITGDLMLFAHGLADKVQANLSEGVTSAEGHQRFIRDTETYLKFVRQIDRLAQIERQLSLPEKEQDQGK